LETFLNLAIVTTLRLRHTERFK